MERTDKSEKSRAAGSGDFETGAVPGSASKGFWALFVVMLGFTFFSASMSVGAKLGNGLSLGGFAGAVAVGGLILLVYTGSLAYVGSATGLSMDLLARRAFGTKGSYLPSAMIALTQIGWFGVGIAMFAFPVSELLGINPWILVIVAGVAMTASSWWGIDALFWVSIISVPLITVLGCLSVGMAAGSGNLADLFAQSQSMPFFTAVGLVVGSFVSGGTATPNFVRFARTKWIAVLTTGIAFFLGNTLMFVFGAVGGAVTGQEDIFYVMIAQGLTIPAILVLGANIWTTNDNALYSAGLGLSNITGAKKKPMTLIGGVIGTVAAIWLYNNFVSWLSLLNGTLPPVGAILVIDYFMHRENYREGAEPGTAIKPASVVGVILGAAVANLVPWGIASINAMAVAALCYFVGEAAEKMMKKAG
ncbi:cytosine permease [Oscillospiraceae bacterium OttesenSCG-928-F05]|nr:cytosine permease [Oscillospiraceae bacterium OttesenSCG-928-F05]